MLPVRCHKLKQRASTLKPISSKDEDEGLYAPTPKCFKSYLPLKQKLLTHTPSGRTPMCVSIPFLFLIILKSATLLKSQSVAAQTAKNAIFLVWTDFLPCVG